MEMVLNDPPAQIKKGYNSKGYYKCNINRKRTKQYIAWKCMFLRCYNTKYLKDHPTYLNCTITPEWFDYQVFAKWYDENIYQVKGQVMNLDKDILHKGNKIYSPGTCIFVPHNINSLFVKDNSKRGSLPIGVRTDYKGRPVAGCKDGHGKTVYIGRYDTPELAFAAYRTYKEKLIKKIADNYKFSIPTKLYDAMINYKVEITD